MIRREKVLGFLMWYFRNVRSVRVGGIFHFDVEIDFEVDVDTTL